MSMLTPNRKVLFEPFPKQAEFIQKCFDPTLRYLLYGGAIRSGKSYVSIAILLILCKMFPGSRHIIVRKDLPTLKRNTIPTFNKICPTVFIKNFNRTDWVVELTNASQIIFMPESWSDDPDLNRFRGLEFNTAVLEEVNELHRETFNKVMERCGSWVVHGQQVPNKIICTCNPEQNWVKELFYRPWAAGSLKAPFYYHPAKITDNPHIPADYLENLKNLPDAVYRRFVEGSWDAEDAIDQLVAWSLIYGAETEIPDSNDRLYSLGVDVARYGDDRTVYMLLEGPNIKSIEAFDKTSIAQVADHTQTLMQTYSIDSDRIVIDTVGLGAGVYDILMQRNIPCVSFMGGAKPLQSTGQYKYKNLRAQAYWALREGFATGDIGALTDLRVRNDTTTIRYSCDAERCISIESKDEIKKRIGRSPDFADALSYAYWARAYRKCTAQPGLYVV